MKTSRRTRRQIPRLRNAAVGVCLLALANGVPADDALFQALGGIEGVNRVTEAVLDRVYADERIAFLFKDSDREYLHQRVAEQICVETGGPCEYRGLSMERAHGGFQIRHDEFDAFVEDVILGMEDADVPFRVQNRVLAIFAPMREDIVYR